MTREQLYIEKGFDIQRDDYIITGPGHNYRVETLINRDYHKT